MDDKEKNVTEAPKTSEGSEKPAEDTSWVDDMKQELEDYIEEQGIYIRQ